MVVFKMIIILWLLVFPFFDGNSQHYRLYRMLRKENFSEALSFGEAKLEMNKGKRERNRLKLLLALGKLYDLRGNFTKAEALYLQALDPVRQKIERGERLKLPDFNVIDEISLFYVHTGNFTEAGKWTEYSLKKRAGEYNKRNPVNFRPYISKGMLFFYQNEWDSAVYYLTEYQKNIRNSNYTGNLEVNRYADTYQVLAELELKRGNLHRAFKNAKKTVRLQKHEWTRREAGRNTLKRVKAMNTLSTIYRYKEQWKKSERYLTMAMKLYDKNIKVDFPERAELYLNGAWHAWHVDEIDSVIARVKKAVSIELDYILGSFTTLSEYEKENFQIRHKALFNNMNNLALKLYEDSKIMPGHSFWSELLNYNLQTKGLILNETADFYRNLMRDNSDTVNVLMSEWKMLKNELAFVSTLGNQRSAEDQVDQYLSRIIQIEKLLYTRLGVTSEKKHVDWREVKAILKDTAQVVELIRISSISFQPADQGKREHVLNERISYMMFSFGQADEEVKIGVIQDGKALENRYIHHYLNAIKFRIIDTLSFGQFWQPIEDLTGNARKVILSPDGIFNMVNPGAILNPNTGRYLVDERDIINITNLQTMGGKSTNINTDSTICLFGNPDYSNDYGKVKLEPLEGSEAEVKDIATIVGHYGVKTILNMGTRASESAFKALEGCEIIHVASHGFFSGGSGRGNTMLRAALVLTKSEEEDGFLTAYEAATLNLQNTRLVVLSACETGQGVIANGEGVYGLQRAFQLNGVNHVIMSLWKVDDEVTRQLMALFYKNLMKTNNPVLSLREAASQLSGQYPDPYYWGAFKIVGMP